MGPKARPGQQSVGKSVLRSAAALEKNNNNKRQNKTKAAKKPRVTQKKKKIPKQTREALILIAACLISFIYLGIWLVCFRHHEHCRLWLIQDLQPVPSTAGMGSLLSCPRGFLLERQTWLIPESDFWKTQHGDGETFHVCSSPLDSENKNQMRSAQRGRMCR